jgi:hypothetical protein
MLLLPVIKLAPALRPTPMFLLPVLCLRAFAPMAVFLLPVFWKSAPEPTAVFLRPAELVWSALAP